MIDLSDYFTNLLKVHPGPWPHVFAITGLRVSWTVCIFCLALSRVALLGYISQGSFSYHMYYFVSRMVRILPIGFAYFYKVSNTTPWTLGKIIEGSALLLRVSNQFFCIRIIHRRLQSCQRTWWCFPHELSGSISLDFLGGLWSYLRVAVTHLTTLPLRRSCEAHSQSLFSLRKGAMNVLEELIWNCEQHPGNFSPCLLV